ncbi:MAG: radical SAM domain protein [Rhodospirillaceae bacterium]|nr:MAG: radical SAM domain protein [Rhodospirillaceae bacterium]
MMSFDGNMDGAIKGRKFSHPLWTARGEARAVVALRALRTLWLNTGTVCNSACVTCCMGSRPRNDRLAFLTPEDLVPFLEEMEAHPVLAPGEIGLTGGEPFVNPHITPLLTLCLERGFRVLVLTNALKPMSHRREDLARLRERHGARLALRVSLDHYGVGAHEALRGSGTFAAALDGLTRLARHGFTASVAGRMVGPESETERRQGFAALFARYDIPIAAEDPEALVLFPEMDLTRDVPEITTACWGVLHKSPDSVMCAWSRMIVHRQGEAGPAVVACTLLPYDPAFELGHTLADAARPVSLNHPYCAQFCVLGGGACSQG